VSDPLQDISLRGRRIERGERWVYSAGFNVDPELRDTTRIDTELDDIERIAEAGGRVAILSHQGSHADGSAGHLAHVAAYLGRRLRRPVAYCPDNASAAAAERSVAMRDGEVVLFANTRLHEGEERADPDLARRFAELGDCVAVGGFSKAHRSHASNVGILEFRRGYAASSLSSEIARLAPWAEPRTDRRSVAVVGGLKREKVEVGLASFMQRYDLVIPGGAVLNAVLRARGHAIGASELGECDGATLRSVRTRPARAELHVPSRVVVARPRPGGGYGEAQTVAVADGVPRDHAIVDFELEPWVRDRLRDLAAARGRAVLVGTPTLYRAGFRSASDRLLRALGAPGVESILMGGDTLADLPWSGNRSTGGGSALHYIARGSLPVVDALRAQRARASAA
jgi:phosphoglycerate kinase